MNRVICRYPFERWSPREHLVQNDPQSVDIHRGAELLLPRRLFRSHISWRTCHDAGFRATSIVVKWFGETKVGDFTNKFVEQCAGGARAGLSIARRTVLGARLR